MDKVLYWWAQLSAVKWSYAASFPARKHLNINKWILFKENEKRIRKWQNLGENIGRKVWRFLSAAKWGHADFFQPGNAWKAIVNKQRLSRQLEKNKKDLKSGVEISVKIWRTFSRVKWDYADLFPARKCMESNEQRLLIQLEKIQEDSKSGVEIAIKNRRTFSGVK